MADDKLIWNIIPVVLSVLLGFLLWKLDAQIGSSIAAGLLLELVIVCHRTFFRVQQVLPLLGQISSMPRLATTVADVSRIAGQPGRLRRLALASVVKDFSSVIGQLANGRVSLTPDQFMKIACVLYEQLGPSDSFIATSMNAGGDYWNQNFGADYAQLNRDASGRGASIERIYIFRDSVQVERNKATLAAQTGFSNVYVLRNDQVRLDASEERDVFTINEDIAAEFIFTDQYVIKHIDLITDPEEVQEIRRLLVKLRKLSTRYGSRTGPDV